ncbi:MAG: hypothetical protein C5B57_12440 [Blastocatellia bacterium]|nr:MAG: hypothetical protein C5B57_12440 [Blastocatellia bacterium]
MRGRIVRFVLLLLLGLSVVGVPTVAQEGHPLKGSWIGTWSPNKTHGNDLVIVLNWDGKNITGTINPGTDNMMIKNATLNPEGWIVHLEADAKDKSGAMLTYILEGKIENLPLANRSIVGTWKNQKEGGTLKVSRQ